MSISESHDYLMTVFLIWDESFGFLQHLYHHHSLALIYFVFCIFLVSPWFSLTSGLSSSANIAWMLHWFFFFCVCVQVKASLGIFKNGVRRCGDVAQWVDCLHNINEAFGWHPALYEPGVEVHSCNSSIWEGVVGGPEICLWLWYIMNLNLSWNTRDTVSKTKNKK